MSRGLESIRGFIDAPRGAVVPRGDLRVTGWALGPDGPLAELLLLVDGRIAEPVRARRPRPDVVAAHPDVADAAWAGWEATVDLRRVGGPAVEITLLAGAAAGGWQELARHRVRVDHSRSRGGRRARAVFTIVQNEADFLPLWLGYYGGHFDPEDIYVLDHDSTDGSTDGLGASCNVVPVHRDKSFDHVWLKATVEAFQAFLLTAYEAVLFAEADEFVVADPRHYAGLAEYADSLEGPAACCTGFNVVHYPDDGEPELRFELPLLGQRRFWHRSPKYSKRVLSKVPLRWTIGFHLESTLPDVAPDPDLYLIHLHRADYVRCLERHRAAVARDWSRSDLREGFGRETRVVDEAEFREWFYAGADLEGSAREPIPEHLAGTL